MKYVEIIADSGSSDTVLAIAKKEGVQDIRLSVVEEDGVQKMRMLVSDDKLQLVLDALQNLLTKQPSTRIVVLPVDVLLPKSEEERSKKMLRPKPEKHFTKKLKKGYGLI